MLDETPWIVIPARGGSTGVPRKNVRSLAGKPLIAHVIDTARSVVDAGRVVVITDDDEIDEIARHWGATVIREPQAATGAATLDEVILRHIPDLMAAGALASDILLTMQPTCPLVRPERIAEAVDRIVRDGGCVITVVDDRHLTWGVGPDGVPEPLYPARVNRQLLPARYRESGAIIGARISSILEAKTRIVAPIALVSLDDSEAVDIDTFADWAVAEHWLRRRSIVIRTDAGRGLGMGHVYRSLALAYELSEHDITLVTSRELPLGSEFFARYPFVHREVESEGDFVELVEAKNADLVVLDVLDTEEAFVSALQALRTRPRVVSFEDHGSGAHVVDLLVCDIYENPGVTRDRQLTGIRHAVLAPSFESLPRVGEHRDAVSEVLVLFGGTDPSGLARKALEALELIAFDGHVTVVRGLGAEPLDVSDLTLNVSLRSDVSNMAELMASTHMALSSAGRTLAELATVGVPTVCLAQNARELRHTHATVDHGVVMLGLGSEVSTESLARELETLIADADRRRQLRLSALNEAHGRSNSRIVRDILRRVGLTHDAP